MQTKNYSKEDLIEIFNIILNKYIKDNNPACLSRDIFLYYLKKDNYNISKGLINKHFGSYRKTWIAYR